MLQIPATQDAEALLTKAERYLAKGGDQYRLAREAMKTAQALDPKVMTNRYIAKRLGRSHRWVNALMKWDGEGTPFEKKVDASDTTDPRGSDEPAVFLREGMDVIEMGNHWLVYGDSTFAHSKLELFLAAGLPILKEAFDPDAIEEDDGNGVVVCTDPPYGIGQDGMANDDRADWGEVYRLFRPRGGYAFCAFKPPQFLKAQKGIETAHKGFEKTGWKVKHYLAMQNIGGQPWGGRVQNSLDGILFFERDGEDVWPLRDDCILASLQKPSPGWVEQRKQLAGTHRTPKPINILINLIRRITDEGDWVLDPFAGSGTTLVACERIGRRFIGLELKGKHVQQAVRNWQREPGNAGKAIVHRDFAEPIPFDELEHTPGWGDYIEEPEVEPSVPLLAPPRRRNAIKP